MKNDKYLKIILTIIAICLVWICVRDIKIGSSKVYAKDSISGETEVYVTGVHGAALSPCEPIMVHVMNWPDPQSIPQKEEK